MDLGRRNNRMNVHFQENDAEISLHNLNWSDKWLKTFEW